MTDTITIPRCTGCGGPIGACAPRCQEWGVVGGAPCGAVLPALPQPPAAPVDLGVAPAMGGPGLAGDDVRPVGIVGPAQHAAPMTWIVGGAPDLDLDVTFGTPWRPGAPDFEYVFTTVPDGGTAPVDTGTAAGREEPVAAPGPAPEHPRGAVIWPYPWPLAMPGGWALTLPIRLPLEVPRAEAG